MSKIISGVEYENGHMTGVTISGIVEVGEDEPVTAFFRREEHGRWIERKSFHAEGGISAKCSVCQKNVQYLGNPLKFCPNCGAKMDLEE